MKKSESQSNFLKNSKNNIDDNATIEYNRSNTLENNNNFVITYPIF